MDLANSLQLNKYTPPQPLHGLRIYFAFFLRGCIGLCFPLADVEARCHSRSATTDCRVAALPAGAVHVPDGAMGRPTSHGANGTLGGSIAGGSPSNDVDSGAPSGSRRSGGGDTATDCGARGGADGR